MKTNQYTPNHISGNAESFKGNENRGCYVFLPGGVDRAKKIAEYFSSCKKTKPTRRSEHQVWKGTYQGIDVAVVSSGMGPSSAGNIVPELINCNVKRILRVGTCGAKQEGIPVGACIIATGAVRDEDTSDAYAVREYPAIAHPDAVHAAEEASRKLNLANLTYKGIVHTKSQLERELREGSLKEEHEKYMAQLKEANVIASSMEESVLFVIASAMKQRRHVPISEEDNEEVRAGCILAAVGGWENGEYIPFADEIRRNKAEERIIQLSLETIVVWADIDRKIK